MRLDRVLLRVEKRRCDGMLFIFLIQQEHKIPQICQSPLPFLSKRWHYMHNHAVWSHYHLPAIRVLLSANLSFALAVKWQNIVHGNARRKPGNLPIRRYVNLTISNIIRATRSAGITIALGFDRFLFFFVLVD